MGLTGRKIILSDVEFNDYNIVDELHKLVAIHKENKKEIEKLYEYYTGKQLILNRTKKVRADICNRIVENHANEIISFKVGYLCGEPIQFVGRTDEAYVSEAIQELNEMMFSLRKASLDKRIVEWQMIGGTAYKLTLPLTRPVMNDEAPFKMYSLDPRDTFVVYSTETGNEPILGVKMSVNSNKEEIYSVYSRNHFWKIKNKTIEMSRPHALHMIPIVEYPANNARLGAFEIVMDLLDEINNIASNRMDGIEQFVQAFMKFINCDISKEEYAEFLQLGAIKVKSVDGQKADVDMVSNELDQSQTQTTKDDVYNTILTICGMPNRNGGSSTSDTGAAVLLRDGWSLAEARAKDSELMFKESEQETLKLILRIIRDKTGLNDNLYKLKLKDIDMKFTRRNYDNIQSKAQVLDVMLKNEKIHPRLAFIHCGLFTDPESAYQMSKQYAEEYQVSLLEAAKQLGNKVSIETSNTDSEVNKTQGQDKS